MASDISPSELAPFQDIETACRAYLKHLKNSVPFSLWMITRKHENDWTIIYMENSYYDVREGDVLDWADSFCCQLMQGKGPNFCPIAQDVPAYNETPIKAKMDISSYVGVPLYQSDGELFGTLCAIDPKAQSQAIQQILPFIYMQARLLSTLLNQKLLQVQQQRELMHTTLKDKEDQHTQLLNRLGWDLICNEEQVFVTELATPIYVVMMEYTGTTQDFVQARLIISTFMDKYCQKFSYKAQLSDNLFALLLIDIGRSDVEEIVNYLGDALIKVQIPLQIGFAKHRADRTISKTVQASLLALKPITSVRNST